MATAETETFEAIQWTGRNIAELREFDQRIDSGDDAGTVAIDDGHEPLHLPVGCWIVRDGEQLLGVSDKQLGEFFEDA